MPKNETKLKTVEHINGLDKEKESQLLSKYSFQEELTKELDGITEPFDAHTINKIVLWKVNRFAQMNDELLGKINALQFEKKIDEKKTYEVLAELLQVHGIRLPMASTILRFRNRRVYQIFDQRVYRILSGEEYKHSQNIATQVELYLEYLKKLREFCSKTGLSFESADRTLYELDKEQNGHIKIRY